MLHLVFHFLMEAYVSDRVDLQAKVAKSKKARVKDNSRGQYANSAVRFIQWLSANEHAMLNQDWVKLVEKDVGKKVGNDGRLTDEFKKTMKVRLLAFDLMLTPLHFAQVKTSMFLQWVHSLSTDYDAASGHRSAHKDFADVSNTRSSSTIAGASVAANTLCRYRYCVGIHLGIRGLGQTGK
jgi:hypothetical protein